MNSEQYLKPDVIQTIKRLDLRAKFIVKGFLQGLHASPFQGFSVEFSEHRRYAPGDDPDDIDWLAYAKTDKYYIKKFEAQTNITGWLIVDTSKSMGYSSGNALTKFDYCISLAAALGYLMISQQDPVGLITFDEKLKQCLKPHSRRGQLAQILSLLTRLTPTGETDLAQSLIQTAAMLRHKSLLIVFTDLLTDKEELIQALYRLRHAGHDIILFHVMDQSEVNFPFNGDVEMTDPETGEVIRLNADGIRQQYLKQLDEFREFYMQQCSQARIDYVALSTDMPFDKALTKYLLSRKGR
ncbi:MAG: DUF58 domain-containing protein [Thermoguttaceae bacterium]|nr:DUF58 domain-containing protein [Thermoguttaceae bacterium]MBQ6615859.1 DUF58 domain-containing protein [Thermoguttaceae bacterium]